MRVLGNPRESSIKGTRGRYKYLVVTIPKDTARIVSSFYSNGKLLPLTFAIDLFWQPDHDIKDYMLRIYIPYKSTRVGITFENSKGQMLDAVRHEL